MASLGLSSSGTKNKDTKKQGMGTLQMTVASMKQNRAGEDIGKSGNLKGRQWYKKFWCKANLASPLQTGFYAGRSDHSEEDTP